MPRREQLRSNLRISGHVKGHFVVFSPLFCIDQAISSRVEERLDLVNG